MSLASKAVNTTLIIAALLALAPPFVKGGEKDEPATRGELLYRIHCSNCHGADGKGDGPMVEVLKVHPGDLTHLAAAHGGTFPREEVDGIIDGRLAVRGHGMEKMPVWGITFQVRGNDSDQEAEVQGRIHDLLAYLESIQVDDGER